MAEDNGERTIFRKLHRTVMEHLPEKVRAEVDSEIVKQENRIMKWLFGVASISGLSIAGVIGTFSVMQYQVDAHSEQLKAMPAPSTIEERFKREDDRIQDVADDITEVKDDIKDI